MRSRSVSGPRGRNSWQDSCGPQLDTLSMVQGWEGRCGGLGTYFNLCNSMFNSCIKISNQLNKSQASMTFYALPCPLIEFFSMA